MSQEYNRAKNNPPCFDEQYIVFYNFVRKVHLFNKTPKQEVLFVCTLDHQIEIYYIGSYCLI